MSEINRRLNELENITRDRCPLCGGDEIRIEPIGDESTSREPCPACGAMPIVLGPIQFDRACELNEKSGGNWNLETLSTAELIELRTMTENHHEH